MLGARYLVEGSVRQTGEDLRVIAKLIDGSDGHAIWAKTLDAKIDDLIRVESDIAHQIAAMIVPELECTVQPSLAEIHEDAASWAHYQRGMHYLGKYTKDDTRRARECFDKALGIDPDYARGHAGLAYSHHRDILHDYTKSRETSANLALKEASRSVELHDSDPFSHLVMGYACLWSDRLEQSIAEFERTLELNPSDAMAHISLGGALDAIGRPKAAIPHYEAGIRLNPQDPRASLYYALLARAHLNARSYETAIEWSKTSLSRRSGNPHALLILAISLAHGGRFGEAKDALSKLHGAENDLLSKSAIWTLYRNAEDRWHLWDGLRKARFAED